jgi:hypothetical protein
MAERFLDLLLRGMQGLHELVLGVIKRHPTPPTLAEQQDT